MLKVQQGPGEIFDGTSLQQERQNAVSVSIDLERKLDLVLYPLGLNGPRRQQHDKPRTSPEGSPDLVEPLVGSCHTMWTVPAPHAMLAQSAHNCRSQGRVLARMRDERQRPRGC